MRTWQEQNAARLAALARKPFDNGPYHDERLPGERCAYEERFLLGRFFQERQEDTR